MEIAEKIMSKAGLRKIPFSCSVYVTIIDGGRISNVHLFFLFSCKAKQMENSEKYCRLIGATEVLHARFYYLLLLYCHSIYLLATVSSALKFVSTRLFDNLRRIFIRLIVKKSIFHVNNPFWKDLSCVWHKLFIAKIIVILHSSSPSVFMRCIII